MTTMPLAQFMAIHRSNLKVCKMTLKDLDIFLEFLEPAQPMLPDFLPPAIIQDTRELRAAMQNYIQSLTDMLAACERGDFGDPVEIRYRTPH